MTLNVTQLLPQLLAGTTRSVRRVALEPRDLIRCFRVKETAARAYWTGPFTIGSSCTLPVKVCFAQVLQRPSLPNSVTR